MARQEIIRRGGERDGKDQKDESDGRGALLKGGKYGGACFSNLWPILISHTNMRKYSNKSTAQVSCNGMKTPFFAFMVATSLSVLQGTAADHPLGDSQVVSTNISTGGTLQITKAPVNVLLDIYTHVSGWELITASNVSQLGSNVVVLPDSHGGGELLKEIEKALLNQRAS